jgi:hypothetical protein
MVDYHPRLVWWYLFFSCANLSMFKIFNNNAYSRKHEPSLYKNISTTDLIWQLRYKFITDNINLVIDDLFTFVFLRVYLLGPLVEGFMVDYHPRLVWWYLFFSCANLSMFKIFNNNAYSRKHVAAILWLWIVTYSRTCLRFQSFSTGSWTLSPFTPFCVCAPLSINYSIENNYLIVDFSWCFIDYENVEVYLYLLIIYRYYLLKNENRHSLWWKTMLPLVEGVMVDHHTQEKNIMI